jgi:hypothetical protein
MWVPCAQLECIEDACATCEPTELAQKVVQLLGADEDEVTAAATAIL